jgi:capsule polysaccharide export protein KpsE/RkpR
MNETLNTSNPDGTTSIAQASLINLIRMYKRKFWLLLIIGFLAGVAGFFYAMRKKPVYESKLTFALDAGSDNSGLSGAMNLAAQFGFNLGNNTNMFDGDNIIQVLKSRRIIESVFLSVDTFNNKRYTLAEYYIENSDLRTALNKKERTAGIHFPPGIQKNTLNYLQDSILNVVYMGFSDNDLYADRPDKKLSIYEIRIRSFNEKFSKIFTDKLIETASTFYTEITSRKDRETLEILEQRVASLKSGVGLSIDIRASSQDANVNPAFAAAQSPLLKQQYNMQAYGEAYKEMFKTLEMARYQYLKRVPLLQIIDNADYPMTRIKVSRLKTAVLFSFFSVFITMLAIWIIHLLKKSNQAFK